MKLNKKQKIFLILGSLILVGIVSIYTVTQPSLNTEIPEGTTTQNALFNFFGLQFISDLNSNIDTQNSKVANIGKPFVPALDQAPPHSIINDTGQVRIDNPWSHIKNTSVRSAALGYEISPHARTIVFNSDGVRKGTKTEEPQGEFIVIEARTLREPVIITDWKVVVLSKKRGYKIPEGVLYYRPREKNTPFPIRLQSGWEVIINTGESPIGRSFHINKCSGYAEQFKDFTPAIKLTCPMPEEEVEIYGADIPFSDSKCFDIIYHTQRCSAIQTIPETLTRQCQLFMKDVLTERGCVERHRNENDYLTGIWRIYLNRKSEIFPRSDALFLLDEEDRLVDVIHYR